MVPVAIPILEAGARTGKSTTDIRAGAGVGVDGDPMFTLQSGKQHAVGTSSTGDGYWMEGRRDYRNDPRYGSHANGGGQVAVAFDTTQITSKANRSNPKPGDACHPLTGEGHPPALAFRAAGQDGFRPREISPPIAESDGGGSGVPTVMAFQERGRKDGPNLEYQENLAYSLNNPGSGGRRQEMNIATESWAVRRLTPIETSRLQGFPDTYAHIPRRSRKIEPDESAHYISHGIECWRDGEQWFTKAAADGPIYRSHGNSMAVPVMRWIGERIKAVDATI